MRIRKSILLFVAFAAIAGTAGAQMMLPVDRAVLGVANLAGENEIPAVDTAGRGHAVVTLGRGGQSIDFRLSVTSLDQITQAHIHCGEANVNGPVVAFLFGLVSGGVTLNGILANGTVSEDDIIPRASCGVTDLDSLLREIRRGAAYINVHTIAHPGGEIRGQIVPPGLQ